MTDHEGIFDVDELVVSVVRILTHAQEDLVAIETAPPTDSDLRAANRAITKALDELVDASGWLTSAWHRTKGDPR